MAKDTGTKPFNNPFNPNKWQKDKIEKALEEALLTAEQKKKVKKIPLIGKKKKPKKKKTTVYQDGSSFSQHGDSTAKKKTY